MSTICLSMVDKYPGVEIEGFDRSGVIVRETPSKIPIGRRNTDGISFINSKIPGASAGCAIVGNVDGDWELHIWHDEKPMLNGVRVTDADEVRLTSGDIIGIVQTGFTREPSDRSGAFGRLWRKLTGKGQHVGVAARIRVEIKPGLEDEAEEETDAEDETEPEIGS